MDEEAVRAEFASFINKQRLNQQQIVFLDKIINHILNNGYVDTPQVALTKAPFDRPYGLFALFEVPQVMEIMQIVNSFTVNAAIKKRKAHKAEVTMLLLVSFFILSASL